MAQYTHKTPPNHNPPYLSVSYTDIVHYIGAIIFDIAYDIVYYHRRRPVLGRVPLIPCYLNGNSVKTIPHCFRGKIPREAAADSRPDNWTGSRLFEINMSFPRQISVDLTLWKDLSSSNLCGSSYHGGIAQKEGAGIQVSWR